MTVTFTIVYRLTTGLRGKLQKVLTVSVLLFATTQALGSTTVTALTALQRGLTLQPMQSCLPYKRL